MKIKSGSVSTESRTDEDKKNTVSRNAAEEEFPPDAPIASSETTKYPVSDSQYLCIVGIGASAGGIDALKQFFMNMPPHGDVAFVVVTHLNPDHKTRLPEILSNFTKMEVCLAEEGTAPTAETVYVAAENRTLTMVNRRFHLEESLPGQRPRSPIDNFLISLASEFKEKSVAVILSGTGNDGEKGILAVKEAGGIVLVQEEDNAEYGGMPHNAIATGLADFILPADKLPAKIVEIFEPAKLHLEITENVREAELEDKLHTIFHIVNSYTGNDFSSYKKSTIIRRIQKRMASKNIVRLEDYIALLKGSPEESKLLGKDILIKVTAFFRDPQAFEVLQSEVVPRLFADGNADSLRIWIAGCSTGEEAFSVGIVVQEYMQMHRLDRQVRIFATDIDEDSIARARSGIFSAETVESLDERRLKDFFEKAGSNYKVSKPIRDMIIFARHDLIKDPPFDKIDLVICRNFLIYLDREMQERIIPLFFHVLKPGGTLFLGTAETLGGFSDLFHPLDKKWKIFTRKEISRRVNIEFPVAVPKARIPGHGQERKCCEGESLRSLAEKTIMERYFPLFVVINEKKEVTYYSAGMGRFIDHPEGEPTQDITKIVRKELRPILRATIHKAFSSQEAVSCNGLKIRSGSREEMINLLVEPLTSPPSAKGLALVIFEPAGIISGSDMSIGEKQNTTSTGEMTKDAIIRQLEEQLRLANEQLQSTVENLESSNEELKSSNEELMSMNEEFQSANEELETSKEELQTLNDELGRVNTELEKKVAELGHANNDMMNLMFSSETATIFLDRKMRIKNFTPSITGILNVIMSDIGRPFSHLSGKIDYPGIDLDAEKVLRDLVPVEHEVKTIDGGKKYLSRFLPYRTMEGNVEGVVLTFFDITELRLMEEKTVHLASFPQYNPNPVLEICGSGRLTFGNPAAQNFLEKLGLDRENLSEFFPEDLDALLDELQKNIESVFYREVTIKDSVFAETVHLVPQFGVVRIYGYDITLRKRMEEEQETAVQFLRLVNNSQGTGDLIRAAVTFFRQRLGCEAVGIRTLEGDDYPYYEAQGFPRQFVIDENLLCDYDDEGKVIRDSGGNPVLECMCGNVICGRFDPSKPFFTKRGSFWTNSTSELLAGSSEADRQARTRNRCNGEGYESVALIPLHFGEERLGLLQLNDSRRGLFTLEYIDFLETMADHLAVALAKFRAEEAMRESEQRYHSLFENMQEGLAYCKMLYDRNGSPVDFIYLKVNESFGRLTGLVSVEGKKVSEVIPGIRESYPDLFEIYSRVALTGNPEKFEIEFKPLDVWLSISVYSMEREYFVAVFDNITDRKRAEQALQESEERWQFAIEGNNDGVWDRNVQTGEVFFSVKWKEMLGFAEDEIGNSIDEWTKLVHPEDLSRVKDELDRHLDGNSPGYSVEYRIRCKDYSYKWVLARGKVISRTEEGKPLRFIGTHTDITDRKILEAQLYQAQKMEAIGQLAGGVAHDFNNILTAIIGYSHLAQMKISEDDPIRNYIVQIYAAAERAAELTQGLLAFSRKQVMVPKVINLNNTITNLEKLLHRLISENIDLCLDTFAGRLKVMADNGKIEQVIVNLVTNAGDAMPDGGTLTIATFPANIDGEFINRYGYGKPGTYACISVSDTGCGMDEKTSRRIFEPFFTTKEVGKGTGLGLSIAYGIVKQHYGYIIVDSTPGRGTRFVIYLPLVRSDNGDSAEEDLIPIVGGNETILLAEDDQAVRDLHRKLLENAGYIVITAADGEEAVQIFSSHERDIDLLIFDIIMPRLSGRDAYSIIGKQKNNVKVLFLSGYPVGDIKDGRITADMKNVLAKPSPPRELLRRIREELDNQQTG